MLRQGLPHLAQHFLEPHRFFGQLPLQGPLTHRQALGHRVDAADACGQRLQQHGPDPLAHARLCIEFRQPLLQARLKGRPHGHVFRQKGAVCILRGKVNLDVFCRAQSASQIGFVCHQILWQFGHRSPQGLDPLACGQAGQLSEEHQLRNPQAAGNRLVAPVASERDLRAVSADVDRHVQRPNQALVLRQPLQCGVQVRAAQASEQGRIKDLYRHGLRQLQGQFVAACGQLQSTPQVKVLRRRQARARSHKQVSRQTCQAQHISRGVTHIQDEEFPTHLHGKACGLFHGRVLSGGLGCFEGRTTWLGS